MTTELISPPAFRPRAVWAGRVSQHRRTQVGARAPESGARLREQWESLAEVLRGIESPTSALLCTAGGSPVAAYGLPGTDLPRAARRTRHEFAARTPTADADGGEGSTPGAIETLELTSGHCHTVIASVPGSAHGDHLLAVTAEGVSLRLLQAWTRLAAEDLRELLADQPLPRSSSAAV